MLAGMLIKISDPNQSAEISEKIDALFKNSPAETKTETERAFQQGFLASTSAIITSMNVIVFCYNRNNYAGSCKHNDHVRKRKNKRICSF